MKHKALVSLLVIFLVVFVYKVIDYNSRMWIFTIPKSGTYLIAKAVKPLSQNRKYILRHTFNKIYLLDPKEALHNILYRFFTSKKTDKVVLVRDLRDIFLSLTFYTDNSLNAYTGDVFQVYYHFKPRKQVIAIADKWKDFSLNEKLTAILEGGKLSPYCDYYMMRMIQEAIKLLKMENSSLVKFEELIGPKGKGDIKEQQRVLQNLARILKVSEEKIDMHAVARDLFGNSKTFNKGQIGRWKEYFTDAHKKLFKEKYGEFLIQFGYEADDNW